MKFYIVAIAFAVIATAAAEEWTPKTPKENEIAMKKCLAENPLSEKERENSRKQEYPDTEAFHKLVLCCAKSLEIFSEEGGYHAERVVMLFPTHALERVGMDKTEALSTIEKCADKNEEETPVEVWAFRGFKCIMNSKFGDFFAKEDRN